MTDEHIAHCTWGFGISGVWVALAAYCLLLTAYCLLPSGVAAAPKTVVKVWDTKADFERCTWDGNIEVTDDGTVRLKKSVLLQDEQGATHYNNTEQLSATVWAKKQFVIDDPACDKAELFVFYGAGAKVMCNETVLTESKPLPSTGWHVWTVPPELLKKGVNEFVFSGGGQLLIEHSLYPNRSARSLDGGRTWGFDQLGFGGVENGEYVVRLRLAQYPRQGMITSEVIDLAPDGSEVAPPVKVRDTQVNLVGNAALLEVRTGATPTPDASWSSWQAVNTQRWERFVQWRAWLKITGATQSPTLRKLQISATIDPSLSTINHQPLTVKVLGVTPVTLHRSSYPFAYQPPTGRLNLLRTRYKLDEVVAKGDTELEKFVLLREWARFTAPKGWDHGTTQWCPPWDALIILETNKQPLALCMCTHYSTVFVQCALALGYNARHVILDHHCVAEVWSNQFRKWVLMDTGCSTDPTLNCHFEKDGVPLNALEIRNLWKANRASEIEVVYTPPRGRINGADIGKKNQCGFENYRRFAIPFRNNHLVTPFPGELEQGQSQYYGDFYLWWEDQAVPTESPEYGKTSCRPADFYWTLNETAIDLVAAPFTGAESAGEPQSAGIKPAATLQVTLVTVTPNFDRFLVSIDGGAWEAKPANGREDACATTLFAWKLHTGENVLRVKSVNRFGVEGVESVVRLMKE